jgi:DNA mismatch repair protein MutS
MSVVEKNGEIRFLHTLTTGPAVKSYGIHVAKLAGIPLEILTRARDLLRKNEDRTHIQTAPQLSLFDH